MKRSNLLTIRVTKAESASLKARARDHGITVAQYVRARCISDEDGDGGLGELLGRIGMGQPIWPNPWSQDVAMVAFVIKSLQEQLEAARIEARAARSQADGLNPRAALPVGQRRAQVAHRKRATRRR